MTEDAQEEFFEAVAQLTEAGFLKSMPGGRVRLGSRKPEVQERAQRAVEEWEGVLSVHPRGFGFVTAVGRDDVFVPPDRIYEALHGDTVHVQIVGRGPKGVEGSIQAVVRRRNPRVAGVLRVRRKSCWLEPDDSRLRGPITITEGEELARDGDAAVIDITRFPLFADELCEGRVVQVLGPQGDPQTEVLKILVREQVVEEHAPKTLENAKEMAEKLRTVELGHRRDLRRVPLPTIDPEDARDHDDAVWVERNGRGYRAYVAIADVSEFVREESALDEEARARGCTIYLPDRAIPMLPSTLAADLCSLLPHVDRYCLCVIADIGVHGEIESYELVEGVMRSAAKLTYGGVARALGFDPESPSQPEAEAMKADLDVLAELAFKLRKKRMTRGALDLDLPEARVHLDSESGHPTAVTKRATRPGLKKAYSMIEEMMLLANELVAEWLTKKNAPAIFRVHGKPDPQKLDKLVAVGEKLGIDIDTDRLSEPLGVSEFLRDIQGHERATVLSMLLLRTLKQAQYDIENVGHFGLASTCYLHFTSPIRRYPDLCVHRQVKGILRGTPIDRSPAAVEILRASATESSTRERAAMEIEREVVDLYRTLFMQQHVGERFEGRVTGVTGSGIYVALDDPFCDVMVRYESLGPDHYELSDDEISIRGSHSGDTVTLGDTLLVDIEDAAIQRRTVYGRRYLDEATLERLRAAEARQGERRGFAAAGGSLAEIPRRGRIPVRPGAGTRAGSSERGARGGSERSARGARPGKSFKDRDGGGERSSSAESRSPGARSTSRAGSARSGSTRTGSSTTGEARGGSTRSARGGSTSTRSSERTATTKPGKRPIGKTGLVKTKKKPKAKKATKRR